MDCRQNPLLQLTAQLISTLMRHGLPVVIQELSDGETPTMLGYQALIMEPLKHINSQ